MARADFTGADFTGANLQKAELGRAILVDALLDGADLSYAEIARAVFAGASLAGSDMTGAYTYLARFEATDLSGVKGLTQDQLDAACGDDETRLPAGLTPPEAWPCGRSEEQTSELQSLMRNSYAVFCLKKTSKHIQHI